MHRNEHTGKVGGERWGDREKGKEILRSILKVHPKIDITRMLGAGTNDWF